jgi:hypothetical protein
MLGPNLTLAPVTLLMLLLGLKMNSQHFFPMKITMLQNSNGKWIKVSIRFTSIILILFGTAELARQRNSFSRLPRLLTCCSFIAMLDAVINLIMNIKEGKYIMRRMSREFLKIFPIRRRGSSTPE